MLPSRTPAPKNELQLVELLGIGIPEVTKYHRLLPKLLVVFHNVVIKTLKLKPPPINVIDIKILN